MNKKILLLILLGIVFNSLFASGESVLLIDVEGTSGRDW